jgi:hypothetical protein
VPLAERFWDYVRVTDGCWPWTGGAYPNGYGKTSDSGKHVLAHRASYTLHVGPIPDGAHIMHRCDNRLCVRPDHLVPGSQADNMADMVAKGRDNPRRGETAGRAKVTDKQVREIRSLTIPRGTYYRDLAPKYGITPTQFGRIRRGQSRA